MAKIAFLYPGQGSQYQEMGLDFLALDTSKTMRDTFAAQVGIDALQVMSDASMLAKTQYSQCAIFLHSALVSDYLKSHNVQPDTCLGLSLGEFSSLYQSSNISFDAALPLIVKRAQLMQDAFQNEGEFGMMAIRVADPSKIEEIVASTDDVSIANYNTHQQWVLTGKMEALQALNETHGLRAIFLKVSGAFHSTFLKEAATELKTYAKALNITIDTTNYSSYYGTKFEKVALDTYLYEQMISSVKLYPAILELLEAGYDTFVEVGPGMTLTKMVKQIAKYKEYEVTCLSIATVEQADTFCQQLKEQ